MNKPTLTGRNFPTAQQDAAKDPAKALGRYQGAESAYKLAFTDTAFLLREEMRPVRMQLELLKPELIQDEQGIEATSPIFGSARLVPRDVAQRLLDDARDAGDETALALARRHLEMSPYYEEARRFGALVTEKSRRLRTPIYVVTGGGPGIMEAGNRGAFETGGKSIGLNIVLQHEQSPNPYITPELCFQFHYFGLRKMHFLMRSVALVCFPGPRSGRAAWSRRRRRLVRRSGNCGWRERVFASSAQLTAPWAAAAGRAPEPGSGAASTAVGVRVP